MTDRNVVTLLPSATEIVFALGAEPVAVSHECDSPPEAAEKPRANTCAVDPAGSSEDINAQLEANETIYEIDRDILREVEPDLIITQGICDVCAVDQVLVRDAVAEMDVAVDVLTTDPHSLEDVLTDVRRIGSAIGHHGTANRLVEHLRDRIDAVNRKATAGVEVRGRPRALVLDWMKPPMVAGHWTPEIVRCAGGRYGLAESGSHSAPMDFGDIVEFDPELIIISPCGFGVDQTLAHVDDLRDRSGWERISAVRNDEVYVMDGDVLNCPSPGLVDALETFGHLLHPGQFEASTEPFVELSPKDPA